MKFGSSQWLDVAKKGWARASQDNIGLVAAGVAFYAFLAMIPLMAAIILSYGLLADPQTIAAHMDKVFQMLPGEAASLVQGQLAGIVETSSAKKGLGLALALGAAYFSARGGAGAMILALNIAFDCKDGRSFVSRNITAIAITLGAAVGIVLMVVAVAAFGALGALWPNAPAIVLFLVKAATYLVLALAVATGAALLYRFGPACKTAPLRWLSPGSALAAVALVVLTLGFGFYVSNFGNYNAAYGSLGAVVVLLTWLWLSAYMILLGAEFDAALINRSDTPGTI